MAKDIKIPDIGEKVESGKVVSVLVSKGDSVSVDDPIIEFETDKAVVEIPSPEAGKITEILVSEGDEMNVGDVIARIDTEGKADAEEEEPPEEKDSDKEKAEKEEQPEEEEAEEEPEEEEPEEEEPEEKKEQRPKKDKAPKKAAKEKEAPAGRGPAPASPSVRRLARELGADINAVAGTGPGGRITEEDVKSHVRGGAKPASPKGAPSAPADLPDFSRWGEIEEQELSTVRRLTAESTANSWNTIPHVTQFDRADITGVQEFIDKHSKKVEKAGGKLTITAVLLKVLAHGLLKNPRFNASIDVDNNKLIFKKYVHIGMAVDTERGLLVPVIRDVDQKSILDLAVEVVQMAERTRNKKIKPEDLEGGTFTISNQGGIGGVDFTPIVYWPQVAILGVSRASIQPVYRDGEFKPRTILPLSLSYDHRVIDGADAARFLRWVTESLEHPFVMHLE